MLHRFTAPVVLLLMLSACQSVPTPVAQMGAARSAIEQAQAAGADRLAATEFNSARIQYDAATEAFDRKAFDDARRSAERAEAEAQLSAALAMRQRTLRGLAEVEQSNQVLRNEAARVQPSN